MIAHDPTLLHLARGGQRLLQVPAGSLLQVHSGSLWLCQSLSGLLPGLPLADSLWQARCELRPGQVWQAPETLWLRLDTPAEACQVMLRQDMAPPGLKSWLQTGWQNLSAYLPARLRYRLPQPY